MLTGPDLYRICIKGHLGPEWSEWFEGLTISWDEHDETILTGQILDQAALQGILNKIYDLGLPLLEVRRVPYYTGEQKRKTMASMHPITPRVDLHRHCLINRVPELHVKEAVFYERDPRADTRWLYPEVRNLDGQIRNRDGAGGTIGMLSFARLWKLGRQRHRLASSRSEHCPASAVE